MAHHRGEHSEHRESPILARLLLHSLLDVDSYEADVNFMAWIVEIHHAIVVCHRDRITIGQSNVHYLRSPVDRLAYDEERRVNLARAQRNMPAERHWSLPLRLRNQPLPTVPGLRFVPAEHRDLRPNAIASAARLHRNRIEAHAQMSPNLGPLMSYDSVDPAPIPYVQWDSEMEERPRQADTIVFLNMSYIRDLILSLSVENDEDVLFMVWVYECYGSITSRPECWDLFFGNNRLSARTMVAEYASDSVFGPLPVVDPNRCRLRRGGLSQTRPPQRRPRHPMPAIRMRRRLPTAAAAAAASANDVARDALPLGPQGEPSTSRTRGPSPRRLRVPPNGLRRLQLYRNPRLPYAIRIDPRPEEDDADHATPELPRLRNPPAHLPLPLPLMPRRQFEFSSSQSDPGPSSPPSSPSGPDPHAAGPSRPRPRSDPDTSDARALPMFISVRLRSPLSSPPPRYVLSSPPSSRHPPYVPSSPPSSPSPLYVPSTPPSSPPRPSDASPPPE